MNPMTGLCDDSCTGPELFGVCTLCDSNGYS